MKTIRQILGNMLGNKNRYGDEGQLRAKIAARQAIIRQLDGSNLNDEGRATLASEREFLTGLQEQLDVLQFWQKRVERFPLPTAEQTAAAADECSFLPPDSVKEQVRLLEDQFQRELAAMMEFVPRKAVEAHQRHLAAIQSDIEAGGSADAREGWSQADWEDDYRAKLSAHKNAMKRLGVEAHALVAPYLEQFDEAICTYCDQREESERAMCERFGLKWEPSPVLLLLHKIRISVRATFESFHPGSGLSPRSVASFIY